MNRPKLPLFWRSVFFLAVKPGVIACYIPFLIAKKEFIRSISNVLGWHHLTGMIVFLAGLVVLLHCVLRFAGEGSGTLSPADPTQTLVITGLYRYSRNPMYTGVLCMISGEAIFTLSTNLFLYSLIIFALFFTFVVFWEEPRLKRDFGIEYEVYRRSVRRWI